MLPNILIVTPLQAEYNDLHDSLSALGMESREEQIGKWRVHRFPALNVTLARGGHGKTQFGIQTQYLLDHEQFDLVICVGAAGALAPQVNVGDVIVVTTTVEHDYKVRFVQRPNPRFDGDVQGIDQIKALDLSDAEYKVHFGIMAGGDEDVIDIERGKELRDEHNAIAVAWEGVGGARACAFNKIPFLELRGVTDTADHNAPVVFDVNLKIVMKNIAHLLMQWLRK